MNSINNFIKMFHLIKMDFNRYTGYWWNPLIVIPKMFFNPGMTFSLYYRIERYLIFESNIIFKLLGYLLYPIYYFITYYILAYNIPADVEIGGGLMLHNRDIVITESVKIGKYFDCMGQVTIGRNFNYKTNKIEIGDRVMLGVGSKIIAGEELKIASGVVVGANAVVTKSLEMDNGVYAGIPANYIKIKDNI